MGHTYDYGPIVIRLSKGSFGRAGSLYLDRAGSRIFRFSLNQRETLPRFALVRNLL